jgi:hypothetical protein
MCHPAEAEPLYLGAAGIYRHLDEKATLDLANTLRGLALVNESAAKMDASKALWQEARELYAKCNVEAGVAECNETKEALDQSIAELLPMLTDEDAKAWFRLPFHALQQ